MAITLEQVEKLREKANVSYDEAKAALEAADGDMLEALIYLESKGKVKSPEDNGYYNSKKSNYQIKENDTKKSSGSKGKADSRGDGFGELVKKFGRFCAMLIHKGNVNSIEVLKNGEVKAAFPVTALVLLLVFVFWITVPLIIVGLFFGFRYRFCGPDLGKESVNEAMDEVANTADNIKKSFSAEK